ncbi:AtpZ/AtpI family protein [Sphingomonas sp. BN140010]|uniref:AtpZ/AtpI family protein n=1 Tax=Sphingomonas arvum TaxID=2992113 RepID=A0ABT3JCP6_9SPHN|nr:AtpZ/AtpI family protein [Sphingomonas sp. BN140010]MCW3796843.1 AtpZ/AtpI family protein [Sphingomonas sp. BN140010]
MVEEEPGQDPKSSPDARLDRLEERLSKVQRQEDARIGKAQPADANEQLGQRVLATLIGGIVGGTLIGWALDRLLGTWPLLFISLMVLGTASGFWSIIKMSNANGKKDR